MNHALFCPAPRALPPYKISVPAFIAALLLAPIASAMLTFWAALIPVIALGFGFVPYLIIGGPVLWFTLQRHGPEADCVGPAFAANLIATPIVTGLGLAVFARAPDSETYLTAILFMTGFGMAIAPLWGAVFSRLYRSFS